MKHKDILLILGTSCLMVIIWIIFNAYHAAITSTINNSLTGEILPITPNFDTTVINDIQSREKVTPVFDMGGSASSAALAASPTPFVHSLTPTLVIPTKQASPSAVPL